MFFKKKDKIKEYGIEDILELMKTADARGYYGGSDKNIHITAEGVDVELIGTCIEPVWECFEGACIVKVNNEVVYGEDSRNTAPYHNEEYTYGKYKSREETAQEIMKLLKDKDCVVEDGSEKTKCVFISDKVEEQEDKIELVEEDDMEM